MPSKGDWYWHELTTRDPEGSKTFYKQVLGWDSKPMEGMPEYTLWLQGDQVHGGCMKMEGPEWGDLPSHWMLYMVTDDPERSKADVEAAGGQVPYGPFDVPGVGTILVCKDPAGAVFSLMKPAPEAG